MRTSDVHRSNVIAGVMRVPPRTLCVFMGLMACTCLLPAQTLPTPQGRVVTPAEQAARDDDRIEILRQELKRSGAQLEDLARRKAERLAASDMQGANEAEEQRTRTLSDIAGLERELASKPRLAGITAVVKPSAARTASSHIISAKDSAPWWDVYGKVHRSEQLAVPSATPAQEATRGISIHRSEQLP